MKKFNEMYVIGIDHGYGNMKTANCCFPTAVGIINIPTEEELIAAMEEVREKPLKSA